MELLGPDIIILIETWYARASVLRCQVDTRHTVHFFLLIEAMVGCRPGALKNFKYKDIDLFLQRDPAHPEVVHFGAHIQIPRNKEQEGALYKKMEYAIDLSASSFRLFCT